MSPTGERRDERRNIRTRQNPLGPQERQTRISKAKIQRVKTGGPRTLQRRNRQRKPQRRNRQRKPQRRNHQRLKRHYEQKHGERKAKLQSLKNNLTSQQYIFHKQTAQSNGIVSASFRVSHIIAKNMKPFTDGNYIKDSLIAAVEEICTEKLDLFTQISLSRKTVERRIENISREIRASLNTITTSFVYFSLALDKKSDINDTAQLAIFVRGVDSQMNIAEELLELVSWKCTTTGRYIKDAVINCAQNRQIDLKILVAPFNVEVESAPPNLQMELTELQSSIELKSLCERNKIEYYQKYILKDKLPNLKRWARRIISAFGSTYRCESFFFQIKPGKNKVARSTLLNGDLHTELRKPQPSRSRHGALYMPQEQLKVVRSTRRSNQKPSEPLDAANKAVRST
ncbi:uncharacterized protein TNCV_1618701 [Trichonephila clavipes]|nr:uncharacterized protein TNCV_1618701 [Trichonephila clavipes]